MLDNERLRRENQRLSDQATEPVRDRGMACRLPGGVRSAEELWELLADGRGRHRAAAGQPRLGPSTGSTTPTRTPRHLLRARGRAAADAQLFDPAFFGMSPREAATVDPQQRLLRRRPGRRSSTPVSTPPHRAGAAPRVHNGIMYSTDYAARL
ncbi:hypothetical protein GCM10020218_104200 [Dactylosporangium vinaceum]